MLIDATVITHTEPVTPAKLRRKARIISWGRGISPRAKVASIKRLIAGKEGIKAGRLCLFSSPTPGPQATGSNVAIEFFIRSLRGRVFVLTPFPVSVSTAKVQLYCGIVNQRMG